jgi:outer membrane murein-binding lipoprotein Lpp
MELLMFPRIVVSTLIGLALCALPADAQGTERELHQDAALSAIVRDLQVQVEELRSQIETLTHEAEASKMEAAETRRQLQTTQAQLAASSSSEASNFNSLYAHSVGPTPNNAPEVASIAEQVDLLSAKVNDQYQTKIESGSKYRVRISGLLLLNLFGNRGTVNNIENPALAQPQDELAPVKGTFGGSIRQTRLNFDAFGPTVFGGKSSGTLQMDFSGGFADRPGGSTMGLLRLRTGVARIVWKDTSITTGQDGLFFLPVSPTSYASMEEPEFSYAGNLWAWVPQLRVEHRVISFAGSDITIQAGILDPASASIPNLDGSRLPSVGEQSRRPGVASHLAWSRPVFGGKLSIGTGQYRSSQDWASGGIVTRVNSWLESLDWNIPLSRWTSLSGTVFRGSALGEFGGGVGQNVFFSLPPSASPVVATGGSASTGVPKGLNTVGGWTQLKIMPVRRLEFNFGFGEDNPFASQLERATAVQSYLNETPARNQASFTNLIFHLRSDVLLSAEFRHLRTTPFSFTPPNEEPDSANHLDLAVGYLF